MAKKAIPDEPEEVDSPDEEQAEPESKTFGGGLTSRLMKKFKPRVSISVHSEDMMPMTKGAAKYDPNGWRHEEMKRLKGEIGAIHNRLKTHNDLEAGKQVKSALEHHLKIKKLRLKEHMLKCNTPDGVDSGY